MHHAPGERRDLGRPAVLAAFIDGLCPDSVEHMPFVSSIGKPSRIRTELGYSITCHPSMYTGVWPKMHQSWFVWQKARERSPFAWLHESGIDRLPEPPLLVKYGLWRATRTFKRNSSFFGVPFPAFTPLSHWHCFDVTEKRFWDEDHFNPNYPTIFEIFRREKVPTRILGMSRKARNVSEQLLSMEPSFSEFTYLFFGDVDAVSHACGQDSKQGRERLALVDRAIERWHKAASKLHGEPLFLLWSDHGHIRVEERINPFERFRARGLDLHDFQHVVDSNYLRLWFRDEAERTRAERVLGDLGKGFVITPDVAKKYHVEMPDNRFGDLVYYLEAPAMFDKGPVHVLGRKISKPDVSMHGYSPENRGVDGTLVSNQAVRLSRRPILQDIPPTLLKHYGIPIPEYMVGEALW